MHDDSPERDAEFERWLLDSARREALPTASTAPAWARFAKNAELTTRAAAAGSSASWLHLSRGHLVSLAAGWVLGSALTASVLSPRDPDPGRERDTQGPSVASSPDAQVAEARPPRAHEAGPSEADARERGRSSLAPSVIPAQLPPQGAAATSPLSAPEPGAGSRRRRAPSNSLPRTAPASSLSAEIKALDAVSRAITAGSPELALEGVTRFHRVFPSAQLAADAEGLAIEALLAQGDTDGAARRAAQFLRDYPEDPHAARFAPLIESR